MCGRTVVFAGSHYLSRPKGVWLFPLATHYAPTPYAPTPTPYPPHPSSGDGWSARVEDSVLHGCIPLIIMDNVGGSLN